MYHRQMQLTKFTDLSLRVLMYLTQDGRLTPVTINEIALQFDVPRNHLIKVVTRLNKLGWLMATRGRSGGLRLGVVADQLRLGDVLMELENTTALINCSVPPCTLKGQCHLKEILDIGLNAFYEHMNTYTLADIVNTKMQLVVIDMHKQYQVLLQGKALS
jgi:Rrf2 family nitric oxide-sensitive transcriptional repressor